MEDNEFFKALSECSEKLSLCVGERESEKLFELYKIMLDENTRQNLTRITEPSDAAEKHMADSLTVLPYLNLCKNLADIGCGAGFPTLPLAVMLGDLKITAVDSTGKRIRYVQSAAEKLGLSNVKAVAARAEELGKKSEYREKFDAVTARAVASLNVLCEYCLPLVKVGGRFIAMKASVADELESAKKAISILGGKLVNTVTLTLPVSDSERNIVIIEKIKPTPENYPRAGGAIAKKPL